MTGEYRYAMHFDNAAFEAEIRLPLYIGRTVSKVHADYMIVFLIIMRGAAEISVPPSSSSLLFAETVRDKP